MKRLPLWMLAALTLCGSTVLLAQAPPPPSPPPPAAGQAVPDASSDMERQLDAARERLGAAAREVAELSARLGEKYGQRYMRRGFMMPRAVLGVQIDSKPGAGGAQVVAVSPGGAAAAAGIAAGDVITAIDDQDLSKAAEPARALVERMRELKPDTQVKLRVARGGKSREVEVTPQPAPPGMLGMDGPRGMPPPFAMRGPGEGPPPGMPGAMMGERRGLDGLELATLSPRLGSYFGAKSGVLVVRAGATGFKLEDGDVITAIDGREPSSAAHATRILRSYQRGEKVVIKVLRDRKAVQLDVVIAGE